MRSVTLDAGEALYREGEASDSVYYVETGEVSVSVHKNGKSTILAKRGPSDKIGEMGVIRTSPRSATITAIKESTFVRIPADEFLKAFGHREGIGMKLLMLLCDRLAESDARYASMSSGASAANVQRAKVKVPKPQRIIKSTQPITLFGDSPQTIAQIGKRGMTIRTMRFPIGLAGKIIDRSNRDRLSLQLTGENVQLSRTHFRIQVSRRKTLVIRDMHSLFGCRVNGKLIIPNGKFDYLPVIPVKGGDNEIVAGGQSSSARFILHWQRPEPKLTFIEDQIKPNGSVML